MFMKEHNREGAISFFLNMVIMDDNRINTDQLRYLRV